MKDFLIRTICVLLLAGTFTGYDIVQAMREKDDEIAKLQSQMESARLPVVEDKQTDPGSKYRDGTYTGSAQGYGGRISLEVVVSKGNIDEIHVVSAAKEDAAYWNMAKQLIPQIIKKQTTEIDTISGATFSSIGILNATAEALNQAIK